MVAQLPDSAIETGRNWFSLLANSMLIGVVCRAMGYGAVLGSCYV
jgi:hypothetical protein